MLYFFNKKYYLRDLLEGFVDIHNHILPGIDDGAKNIEESINLISKLADLGIRQFIPTPHIMQGFYSNTYETIGESYQLLLDNLAPKLLSRVTINPASEYMLDDHFEVLLENRNLFTLKKNYVLVEMSYFRPPINLEDIIFKLKTKGYVPVLAHPERYSFYHNDLSYYRRLKQIGCLFQLNMLSLSNHYGENIEKVGKYLIEEGLIDFIGTDTHNEKHIVKLTNVNFSKENLFNKIKSIIENTNKTFSVLGLSKPT